VRTEEVDGKVPVDPSAMTKIIVKVHASVVDQDVERFDAPDSSLNLQGVGHIQGQGRDAPIGMRKGLAHSRIHPASRLSLTLPQLAPVRCLGSRR
jgi:hypothetical protein